MTDEIRRPRLYGTPETAKPKTDAEAGLRGERAGGQSDEATTYDRTVEVDGCRIKMKETSGTAFAESAGKVPVPPENDDPR